MGKHKANSPSLQCPISEIGSSFLRGPHPPCLGSVLSWYCSSVLLSMRLPLLHALRRVALERKDWRTEPAKTPMRPTIIPNHHNYPALLESVNVLIKAPPCADVPHDAVGLESCSSCCNTKRPNVLCTGTAEANQQCSMFKKLRLVGVSWVTRKPGPRHFLVKKSHS